MDRKRSKCLRAIDDMENAHKTRSVAVQLPLGAEEDFEGVIDLIKMKAFRYSTDTSGKFTEEEIPSEYLEDARKLREKLVETVAEAYDALTEKFLETGELSEVD